MASASTSLTFDNYVAIFHYRMHRMVFMSRNSFDIREHVLLKLRLATDK